MRFQSELFDRYHRNLRRQLWSDSLIEQLDSIRASNFRKTMIGNPFEAGACFARRRPAPTAVASDSRTPPGSAPRG